MTRRLENKVAVITGGTSGIGLATAKLFAAEGARVFVTGRRKPELDAAVAEIGHDARGVQADSAKLDDLDRLFGVVRDAAGRIDVLYANAGGGGMQPLGSITEEEFDDTFDRNVKGVVFTVQKALPLLGKGSSVIVTGSTAGSTGTPNFSTYSASKAAVRNLVRSWVLDVKDRGIRINTLSPGATHTPGLVGLVGPDQTQQKELLDYLSTTVPMGRVGEPDEIARTALFLASDDASYVNGAELFVDGGMAQV